MAKSVPCGLKKIEQINHFSTYQPMHFVTFQASIWLLLCLVLRNFVFTGKPHFYATLLAGFWSNLNFGLGNQTGTHCFIYLLRHYKLHHTYPTCDLTTGYTYYTLIMASWGDGGDPPRHDPGLQQWSMDAPNIYRFPVVHMVKTHFLLENL